MKRLTRVVPIRVSRDDRAALRRWAKERRTDVSKVVRQMIEEWRQREGDAQSSAGSAGSAGAGTPAQVGAAA